MNNTQFNLAPQCKMMTISGIDIIGNPETGTIIGLNENGKLLIQNIKNGNIVNIQCMDEEQIDLLGELYREGFFRHDNGNIHI